LVHFHNGPSSPSAPGPNLLNLCFPGIQQCRKIVFVAAQEALDNLGVEGPTAHAFSLEDTEMNDKQPPGPKGSCKAPGIFVAKDWISCNNTLCRIHTKASFYSLLAFAK